MISFILNNTEITTTEPAGSVLLDFIRSQQLTGTKEGCREGDCGACLVLQGKISGNSVIYKSINSCLVPLGNVHGSHIVTIEGIDTGVLNPLQQAFVEEGATQCGYCTPGFILAETAYLLKNNQPKADQAIAALDGNICRCTGYMSIKRAVTKTCTVLSESSGNAKTSSSNLSNLIEKGFLPEYFDDIPGRLKKIPADTSYKIEHPEYVVAGGTDLYVQKEADISDKNIRLIFNSIHLGDIYEKNGFIYLGGGTTVSDFIESDLINRHLPRIKDQLKLHSSTPIRNRATLAGNIVNASPIADMTIILLALDATLLLEGRNGRRPVSLRKFYNGYKKYDLAKNELIRMVFFPVPSAHSSFNFEKVSRRTYLDIASVNTAAYLEYKDDKIHRAHISAGGVAPFPLFLEKTSELLTSSVFNKNVMATVLESARKEISPISDMRGSAEYKSVLLGQLLTAHFLIFFPQLNLMDQEL
ncbi:MAG: FAD binding domain-containing protein [Calditrichae bacterium]|nr:FAD binding domain-containing protein [Calditrichia bacterium]